MIAKLKRWFQRILGRYEGATFNPNRSTIPGSYTSVRFDATAYARCEIARKMRYFERNNSLVQALAGKFENFVVGYNPQLTPDSSDPEWNIKAKAWWDEWTRYCDISSRQSFGTILQLLARRWFIDGDVFVILTSGRDALGARPRLQIIEGHLCRTPPKLEQDKSVHDGVRFDDVGRPVQYYFAEELTQGQLEWGQPRDAKYVLPVFEPERPGELRGISHFHACINELHDLDDLHMLEMQAARENASTYEWIETASGELDSNLLRRQRLVESNQDSSGNAVTDDRLRYYQEISGGRARLLKTGDKISQNPGTRPSVTTQQYWKLKIEMICAAVEIPYCIVFPDSMQGTVYRGALDMAATSFCSRHAVMAEVQRRIWEYVMGFAIKTDRNLADPPADWMKVSILPPRAPNVDVGRNATAEKEALLDGRTNYDLIYGPMGLSWDTELRKLDKQLQFIQDECPALATFMKAQTAPKAPMGQPPASDPTSSEDIPISSTYQ